MHLGAQLQCGNYFSSVETNIIGMEFKKRHLKLISLDGCRVNMDSNATCTSLPCEEDSLKRSNPTLRKSMEGLQLTPAEVRDVQLCIGRRASGGSYRALHMAWSSEGQRRSSHAGQEW